MLIIARFIWEATTKKKQHYKHSRNHKTGKKSNDFHKDAMKITIKDGRTIWFHPSYSFAPDIWANLTDQQRDSVRADKKLAREKAKQKASNRSISQLETKIDSKLETMSKSVNENIQSFISQIQSAGASLPSQIRFQDNQSHTPPSTMGGRNEQIQRRNNGGRTY